MIPDQPMDIEETAADIALGDLSPAELAASGAVGVEEVEAMERAAAMLSLALIPGSSLPLPDALSARLAADAASHFDARPTRRPRNVIAWLGWPVAAAAMVAAGLALRSRPPAEPPRVSGPWVALSATDHPLARGASGQLAWDRAANRGVLKLTGLAAVEPKQGTYQLWIIDARRDPRYPVDGGTFIVADPAGTTVVPIRPGLPVGEASLYAVTLEPPGGVVVSDRKRMMLVGSPAR